MDQVFDLAIIGGGINGCGIAADAALRGLSVILLEKDDLASKTSSASSKLIHGGLRYLEYYDFKLVKKALDERQTLLDLAPHLVHPQAIVLPHQKHMRASWLIRAGLFLYDNLSRKNRLPRSKTINRKVQPQCFQPLKNDYNKGYLFYDCTTDDARLTISNALLAKNHGADIRTNTQVVKAWIKNQRWHLSVMDKESKEYIVRARTVINATGPWVESINQLLGIPTVFNMSLVKGSHLVMHRLYEGNQAYLLQNTDQRVVFVVPYHGFTMIGTTDVELKETIDHVAISSDEVNYLFKLAGDYFKTPLDKKDIINTWSGVRPLLSNTSDDLKTISRDYASRYSSTPAPAVVIYGGKITTYRQAAVDTVNLLRADFPNLRESTSDRSPLPGACIDGQSWQDYQHQARQRYFWLDEQILDRYLGSYGTLTEKIIGSCKDMLDLGEHFGSGLYQVEVDYLMKDEWARHIDDILWRRTKLGLCFDSANKPGLVRYLARLRTLIPSPSP